MTETRKLSTILFADIAGYTALMQKNEALALNALSMFQDTLESKAAQYQGRIIQYYGDGALLAFESVTDGVMGAKEIQKQFLYEHNIPVRIGMHLGEVVFKNDNAFGDGVNIASRLETIGIPGSVLISRAIRDQIKNKQEFDLHSLGKIDFKNIDDSIEVFALKNDGFKIPKKEEIVGKLKEKKLTKSNNWLSPVTILLLLILLVVFWYFQNKKSRDIQTLDLTEQNVAVLPFENQSGDSNLESFGLMIMDWISQGLIETGEANVIKEDANVILAGIEKNPAYVPGRATILIKGRYYNSGGNNITVIAEIVDAQSKNAIYSPQPCTGQGSDPMPLIESVKQSLLGYWVSKGELLSKKPPKYDAYMEFVKAEKLHPKEWLKRVSHFKKAIELDSTFNQPAFELLEIGKDFAAPELADTALVILEARKQSFTDYERLSFLGQKALIHGSYAKNADLLWKLYEDYHQLSDSRKALDHYSSENMVSKCKELFPIVEERENLSYSDIEEQQIYVNYINAYFQNEQYDSTILLIEQMDQEVQLLRIALFHLRSYTRLGDYDKVDQLLEFYENKNLYFKGKFNTTQLIRVVCVDLFLNDQLKELEKYLSIHEKWIELYSLDNWSDWREMTIDYMRGNYEEAYRKAVKHYNTDLGKWLYTETAAVCLIKLGKLKEAEEWKEMIANGGEIFPGQRDYALGIIEGHLGKIDKAIYHFKKANNEGYNYYWVTYRNDFLSKELQSTKEFMELTKAR